MGVGASLIKVQGDIASYADLRRILNEVLTSSDFRERCYVLSKFVTDIAIDVRQENARAMVILLFSDHRPQQEPGSRRAFKQTTPHLVKHCAPNPYGRWRKHTDILYENKLSTPWVIGSVRVSPYLYDLIGAVELLWGVDGHLLKR